jgi:hypothetical protein
MGRQYVMMNSKGCGGKLAGPISWNLPRETEENHESKLVRIVGIITGI